MHWERYPAHIRDRTLKAYRPVLIQVRISVADVLLLFNIQNVTLAVDVNRLVSLESVQHLNELN